MAKTYLFYIVIIMVANVLTKQGYFLCLTELIQSPHVKG